VPVKAPHSHRSQLCDAFFFNDPPPTFRKFQRKGKTCQCLERCPCGVKKGTAAAITENTKKHAVRAL
jgi:hypothetical protein